MNKMKRRRITLLVPVTVRYTGEKLARSVIAQLKRELSMSIASDEGDNMAEAHTGRVKELKEGA